MCMGSFREAARRHEFGEATRGVAEFGEIWPTPLIADFITPTGSTGYSNPHLRSVSDNAVRLNAVESEWDSSCIVCMDGLVGSVFIPCGHAACCLHCGHMIASSKVPCCPICRAAIAICQQLFLP